MSPLSLRRHRAERLLRERFEGLRAVVLASVRGRLAASGVALDEADLQAAYAQAWQGLYTVILEGEQVANPAGWLVTVTHRRALDEHRARARQRSEGGEALERLGHERDLASELDDRARLRQLFEGLRGRLDGREREAATLCYLQGLSRADAAAQMGVSETGMRKLMEGRRPGQAGVAAKVGALVTTIREERWCEEQGSLMRAYAYGILDPAGARHELAAMHCDQCPGCRAYVASLRGLAAVLPPVLLPWSLSAAALAGVGAGLRGVAGAGAGGAASAGGAGGTASTAGAGGATSAGGAGTLGGAASAAGAAGAGAGGVAGGGWLFAGGPLGAKLAVGCLLALGVGAGCVELGTHSGGAGSRRADRLLPASAAAARAGDGAGEGIAASLVSAPDRPVGQQVAGAPSGAGGAASLTPAARASREFGPEQVGAAAGAAQGSAGARVVRRARASAAGASRGTRARSQPLDAGLRAPAAGTAAAGSASGGAGGAGSGAASEGAGSGDSSAAEREFSPG
ncbi:MAG TPA: sigma-70 family RNA polymerase sigma factor [Solirubrobacteraceae bacterium]|jgi:DNA-directed RNA polymerase specialized sigma24 family protein|nr:sigma-70 family RNA polymerase sigma factor [Solirubrobacteraceae bacterium]